MTGGKKIFFCRCWSYDQQQETGLIGENTNNKGNRERGVRTREGSNIGRKQMPAPHIRPRTGSDNQDRYFSTDIKSLRDIRRRWARLFAVSFFLFLSSFAHAQELNATVVLNTQQLGTSIGQAAMNNLKAQLTNFINSRKWTKDNFQPDERISCTFNFTLVSSPAPNTYQAQLLVQAARPVYNSVYQTPLVNYQDQQFTFKAIPYDQLNFNPSQVAGTDPLTANLTATLAFYVNIILGLDYDSFQSGAGAPYFRAAMNIVNGAPQSADIKGWQSFDGLRNRYWLANNLTDMRLNDIHQVFYQYFRGGLDSMYEDAGEARQSALAALQTLQQLNQQAPNSMIEQFFVENRHSEFVGIFKNASSDMRDQALPLLVELDPNSADYYNNELK